MALTLIQVQERLIGDLLRAENVTPCYGNQRKSRRAAFRRAADALRTMGYDEKQSAILCNDAADMAKLELNATE